MENSIIFLEGDNRWTSRMLVDPEIRERMKFYERVSWEGKSDEVPAAKCRTSDCTNE